MNNQLEFKEGYEAYGEGLSLSNNPYDVQSDEHLAWRDGYMDALIDDD